MQRQFNNILTAQHWNVFIIVSDGFSIRLDLWRREEKD